MSDDDSSKTEEPTSKRLQEQREKGKVPTSRDVTTSIMLIAGAFVIFLFGPSMMNRILLLSRTFVERPDQLRLGSNDFFNLINEVALAFGMILLVPALVLLVAAVASGFLQHGFLFSTEPVAPQLSRLNPLEGLKRLFSRSALVELLKSVGKTAIVAGIATAVLIPEIRHIDLLIFINPTDLMALIGSATRGMVVAVIAVLCVIAALDYFYQRYEYMHKMRMTKQELKDEFKQSEGDPLVKSKLRQLRLQKSRKRMMAAVPKATVVITNPTHFAVALKYDKSMGAPLVVAKGADLIALRIREIARENFVPIIENPPLARSLFALCEVDQEIPQDQYKAVAEVIGYVLRLQRRAIH